MLIPFLSQIMLGNVEMERIKIKQKRDGKSTPFSALNETN